MCLHTVKFASKWDAKENDFIGTGYKAMHYDSPYYSDRKWHEAQGWNDSYKGYPIESADYNKYHPGFHIFLNKQDAIDYAKEGGYSRVVEVKYRGIIAFGTNESIYDIDNGWKHGDCVIATHMKVVKVVKKMN